MTNPLAELRDWVVGFVKDEIRHAKLEIRADLLDEVGDMLKGRAKETRETARKD